MFCRRISRGTLDRNGRIYGLTYRVGRHITGIGEIFRDLLADMCLGGSEVIISSECWRFVGIERVNAGNCEVVAASGRTRHGQDNPFA